MVNGMGVLGWGVGGIEAEAAMLGQPIAMLIPDVIGFRLTGKLPEGATATDLVLTVTQMLRKKGVVGKFVEFFGPALDHLPLGGGQQDGQRIEHPRAVAALGIRIHVIGNAVLDDQAARELDPTADCFCTLTGHPLDQRPPMGTHGARTVEQLIVATAVAQITFKSSFCHGSPCANRA